MFKSLPSSRAVALVLAVFALPQYGSAQNTHEPLQTSATLDFETILTNALRHAPEALEATVRQQQAEDYAANGRNWLAGRPSIALNYFDDRSFDNRGLFELEYGIQVPLWRPGERKDAQALGEHYQDQADLWQDTLALTLAGRLRNVLADITEAETVLQLEREATASATELLTVTTRLFDAGALARLDVMQAENLLLQQRMRELQAEAALVDAEVEYTMLSGLESRPSAAHREIKTSQSEIVAEHPLLRYLHSDVTLAEANIRQSELSAKGNPQLSLGSRRERGDRLAPYTDSLALSLTIPIGGRSYVATQTSAARRNKVDAEVLWLNTGRALDQALHEVEHELYLVGEALPLAEQQAALGEQRLAMAQTAFAQGEITLVQVLPAVQEARSATRELALLNLREQRLISEFNQIIGVLP